MNNGPRLTIRVDWISAAREQPDCGDVLDQFGVTSDSEYLNTRSQMGCSVVSALDSLRFRFACGGDARNSQDPRARLEVFAGAPPEVLAIPVSRLRFSARTKSRLVGAKLTTIAEVVSFGTERVVSIEGAGRKVLEEIYGTFLRLTERFLLTRVAVRAPRHLSFHLRRWLSALDERTRGIVVSRLGLSVQTETLEALGAKLALTRERVRQLEAKAVREELKTEAWPQDLRDRLTRLLTDAREPLWLNALPFHDSFFDDFDHGPGALRRVIETFVPEVGHCFEIDGYLLLSRLSDAEFVDLRQSAQEVAKDCVQRRASQIDLTVAIESLALTRGARELSILLLEATSQYLHFARPPGETEPVLVAYGRGVDQIVTAVLEEAEGPLHYSEIHRRTLLRADSAIEVRRVHSSLNRPGVYLFARGAYGLWRHVEVSDAMAEQIAALAEAVVFSADRQWHAGEILASLREDDSELVRELDFYKINAILMRAKRLTYLGRLVWAAANSEHKDSSDRIDIAQACTRFLREAGRPLSRAELMERIRDWRGIGRYFQIHVTEDVIPVAPGVFGLRSRDLPVSSADLTLMLDCVYAELQKRGVGLHESELAAVFDHAGLNFAGKVNLSTFYAFAARDSRLQVDSAHYVGLVTWEDTRRLSVSAAGRSLADEGLSSITAEEYRIRLSTLVGRDVTRLDAVYSMRDNGYTYDQQSKVWTLPSEEDEEDSD